MEVIPDPKEVGSRIREVRQNLGLSMSDFAKRIDDKAKSGTVSNWETGKNLPNNNRLKRIAEIGGITIDYLLYGSIRDFFYLKYEHFISEDKSFIPSITLINQIKLIADELVEKNIAPNNFEAIKSILDTHIPEIENSFLKRFDKYIDKAFKNIDSSDITLNYLKQDHIMETFFNQFDDGKILLKYFRNLKDSSINEKANNFNFLEAYVDSLQAVVEKGFLTDFFAITLNWNNFLKYVNNSLEISDDSITESITYRKSIDLPFFEKGLIIPSNKSNDKLLFIPIYDKNIPIKAFIKKKCIVIIEEKPIIGILISENEIIEENSCTKINIQSYIFIVPILVEFY